MQDVSIKWYSHYTFYQSSWVKYPKYGNSHQEFSYLPDPRREKPSKPGVKTPPFPQDHLAVDFRGGWVVPSSFKRCQSSVRCLINFPAIQQIVGDLIVILICLCFEQDRSITFNIFWPSASHMYGTYSRAHAWNTFSTFEYSSRMAKYSRTRVDCIARRDIDPRVASEHDSPTPAVYLHDKREMFCLCLSWSWICKTFLGFLTTQLAQPAFPCFGIWLPPPCPPGFWKKKTHTKPARLICPQTRLPRFNMLWHARPQQMVPLARSNFQSIWSKYELILTSLSVVMQFGWSE